MPKETVHVPVLKEGRKAKKETSGRYPAGIINLQVLGSGAKGAPRSLYVFTDQTRYLFNCGEGTQRLAHEHKMKLAKLEHIFVTNNSWDNTGGLPGVALTIQDIGVPEITLHGPPRVEKLFEGTRRFVVLNNLKIKVANTTGTGFGDHIMQVDYVKLHPSRTEDSTEKSSSSEESLVDEDETDYYQPIKGCKRQLEITQEDVEQKKRTKVETEEASDGEDTDVVLCYVCRPRKKEGTLLIDKCVEFGVPAGPLLGKLKSGQNVTLPNGNVVKADDVRSPDCPGPVFIVVDCPHEKYLDSFVRNSVLNQFHDPAKPEDFPHIVVHFTPTNVMLNPQYKEWMEKFRIATKHMVINDSCIGMGSEAVHRIQAKLNLLDAEMFPILKEEGVESFYPVSEEMRSSVNFLRKPESMKDIQVPVIMGTTLFKYSLRPAPEVDSASPFTINPEESVREVFENEVFATKLESLKTKLSTLKETGTDIFPEFIFLGTGSCIPNKTRNTSGILVHTDPDNYILMDCGEGTYGQLVRFFGINNVDEILSKLKAVYISHLHADHHIGLVQIIRKRFAALKNMDLPPSPVYLLAPQQIQTWLHLYNKNFERIRGAYHLIPNAILRKSGDTLSEENILITELKHILGFDEVLTTLVRHCPNAFGVAFKHSSGWKITYSGDTMPCDALVELGKDSDVLIHEATMEDDLKQEAKIKMHSTTSEAIEIGNQMGAKFILLTHFSQRYAKVPVINENFSSNVGIAFDNMRVRKCDLPKIPYMYDALKVMFTDDVDEMEQKTLRRLRRKEFEAMNTKQMSLKKSTNA
ncbi:Ribonuclease Z, mitochondrial [Orchesella cincta]|uniref:Zinc phosphodiesterase ELAC protein 2 n=1 Tax=Orchesella cincta TaxID=48709 RepID=A0A1D2N3W1_ORCCI|nr:Ribonuclease Z, mitochondrial [Orchesella cincta]